MKRTILILAGLLITLWGVWYLYFSTERKSLSIDERQEFFWVDSLAVDSAAFKYATWTQLAKRDGAWRVMGNGWDFPANQNLFSRVLSTTNEMVLENIISTNPSKFTKFEVDTNRGRVMRLFTDGRLAAEFVVGKIGADMSHTFVRELGSDSVYLARGRFQDLFTMMPDQWKSNIIMDCDTEAVDTVRWIYPSHETRLARGADRSWTVWTTGMSRPEPADSAAAQEKLGQIFPLRTPAFHPEGNPDVPAFDTLALQLIAVTSDGRADTIIWNALPEGQGKVFARRPGRPEPTFLFTRPTYDRAAGQYEDFKFTDTTGSAQ